jgi:hypothetical protein
MLLGAGEGRSLTIGQKTATPRVAKRDFNVFDMKSKSVYERRR